MPGPYGYFWDMMMYSWDTILAVMKIRDNESGLEIFIDPELWAPNDRWTRHGDMVYQFVHCIKVNEKKYILISIRLDVAQYGRSIVTLDDRRIKLCNQA